MKKQVVFLSWVNMDDVLHICAIFCGFVNSFKDQPVFYPWAVMMDWYKTLHNTMDIWAELLLQMGNANGSLGTAKLVIILFSPFYYSFLQLLALEVSSCKLRIIVVWSTEFCWVRMSFEGSRAGCKGNEGKKEAVWKESIPLLAQTNYWNTWSVELSE